MTETITGTNRSAGPSYQELLDRDTHPVTEIFRQESPLPPGNMRVPAAVYTSRAIHDREVERIWRRSWQLVCLEEEIPEVGDYHVYEVASLSFLVVRTGPEEIKAYANACLHRGRLLRETHGKGAKNLRCAFHGWCWKLDGTIKEIPGEWDFADLDLEDYALPEALVDTWQGFVFLNPDRDASPLSEHLAGLDEHFATLPFTKRFKAAHVEKIMAVNWKACQEAFMESYHVVATHPTLMDDIGDSNSRYDAFGTFTRACSPQAIASPHLADAPTYQPLENGLAYARYRHPMSGFIYERHEPGVVLVIDHDGNSSTFTDDAEWVDGPIRQADPHLCKWIGGPQLPGMDEVPSWRPPTPEGVDPRAWRASQVRDAFRGKIGDVDVDDFSDAEMIDSIYYSVFPNWHPWGPFSMLFYRFRPNGDDPDSCIFEVMMFPPAPADEHRPPPAKVTKLGVDDDWTGAPELGAALKIFQQDSVNLPKVQLGLKAQEQQEVVFASYQETKLRHFYEQYFDIMGLDGTPVSVEGVGR